MVILVRIVQARGPCFSQNYRRWQRRRRKSHGDNVWCSRLFCSVNYNMVMFVGIVQAGFHHYSQVLGGGNTEQESLAMLPPFHEFNKQ